jgi:hypothetical protein
MTPDTGGHHSAWILLITFIILAPPFQEWVTMAEFEYSHDKHVLGTDWKSRVSPPPPPTRSHSYSYFSGLGEYQQNFSTSRRELKQQFILFWRNLAKIMSLRRTSKCFVNKKGFISRTLCTVSLFTHALPLCILQYCQAL